ncbi:TadE/TadG family type IV pilus assembly protein [Nocardioides litoris]|uniref:TadE/TadG family type IV pilus assembly protein n=1 Tax=Nocardioides litoris TaxID=1926648 RepID=UPI00111E8C5E|nr:TadE/TadG family type IV pilus assembly protein [Nocardioides litoris]
MARRRDERGAAVVDFVLVLVILLPLVLGVVQVALTLHVRNTLASAAAEGARYGATQGRTPADATARTREQVRGVVSGRFADGVTARRVDVGGVPSVEVRVSAKVPALGLGGPGIEVSVEGHAPLEPDP